MAHVPSPINWHSRESPENDRGVPTGGQAVTEKINLVLMGGFTYPRGMAGTKRIQNVIDALKQYPGIETRVILQRQSTKHNVLSGVHEGTPYETVMGDLLRVRMLLALPLLYCRTIAALKRAFKPDSKNVIYFYGPLFLESVVPLSYATRLGYRIVFDVNEDHGLAKEVSGSCYLRVRSKLANLISSRIKDLSSGIVVISSYLEEKCRVLTEEKVPIHYLPISVNMDDFPEKPSRAGTAVSLFYAGSFNRKDGLPVLFDAFDGLAGKYEKLRLVLTGRGDGEAMREFFARKEQSPFRDRIEFKGYLDDSEFYRLLNEMDIPCMTRADLAFAHAGFPFKLGEFLATGKPVIASRVSDVDRFLRNGHDAMLVQPGSSAQLSDAIEFLINNPESAGAIGLRGREVARSHFDHLQQGKALSAFLGAI
jgi:glycosyltransferase involved in cell wall biosynthesis